MGVSKSFQNTVLYDESGNPVAVVLDGSVYRIQTVGKVLNAAGDQVNPATQETLASLDGKDFATATNQASIIGYIDGIETLLTSLDGKDFATETTLAGQLNITLSALRDAITGTSPSNRTLFDIETTLDAILAFLSAEDFASETTLAALLSAFNAEDFATAANQTTIIGHIDGVEGLLTTIDAVLDAIYTRLTDRTTRAIMSSGAKGTSVAADLTSEAVNANIEALRVVGPGTPGSSAGGVLSIQGVSGGVAVPVSFAAASATKIIVENLLNAGSPNMIVNGSVTPVDFKYNADPTNDILLSAIRLTLSVITSIKFDGSSFGAGSALTNGVQVTGVVNGGTAISLGTIKQNEEFLRFANVAAPVLSFDGANDLISVQFTLSERVRLVAGSGDYVQVRIADNLTTGALQLAFFRAVLYGVEE